MAVTASAVTACGTAGQTPEQAAARDVVRTDAGTIRGHISGNLRIFRGIPYAAPPTGPHRWQAPQPVEPWPGTRDATRFGPRCPQLPSSYVQTPSTEEDCLSLNVTTPATGPGNRPVMVWIHGDGAIGGSEFFDPARLAKDVVVVTINYRLGVFGAFGYPGLPDSGTYGLLDQQAALRWVRRNAAAFGGDPRNVTLFGESFGALSTTAHLIAPSSKGLFDKAIIQSGFAMMDMPAGAMPGIPAQPWYGWRSRPEVEALGEQTARNLGCQDLECLRDLPADKLLRAGDYFQPYAYGTELLPEVPAEALKAGRFTRVPVLAGATRDEHRLFVGLFHDLAGKPVTTQQYGKLLEDAFGAQAAKVAAEYPLKDYDSPSLAWAAVMTDRMWARATKAQNDAYATYAYEFADRSAPMFLPFPDSFPPGAYHAAELPYLFDDPKAQLNEAQLRLSQKMVAAWTRFARTGSPGWEPYGHVERLAPGGGNVDYAREHRLGFWRGLG